jgi:putative phosphoesterase
MKMLVLSDSHSSLRFMRRCIDKVQPDAVIHLGDYYDDGQVLAEEYPHIPVYQVAGNCDRYRSPIHALQVLCCNLGGVKIFATHGHMQKVKSGIGGLVAQARRENAAVALYGHTHVPDCHQEADGLWVLNPGSAGYGGGNAGILQTDGSAVTACRLLTGKELEEIL